MPATFVVYPVNIMSKIVCVVLLVSCASLLGCVGHGRNTRLVNSQFGADYAFEIEVKKGGVENWDWYRIPAGKEFLYDGPIEIRARRTIVIDGRLSTTIPEEPGSKGHDVILSSKEGILIRGDIDVGRGYDGIQIGGLGTAGGDAGTLTLIAPMIVLSKPLVGPAGGDGAPGGGQGGRGGDVIVYGSFEGPYWVDFDLGRPHDKTAIIKGGPGGSGGPAYASDLYPGYQNGGLGGAGGGIFTSHFKEVPWMVQWRSDYQLTKQEIEAAESKGRSGPDLPD